VRLAVVGDVHLRWDAEDCAAIDARGLDAVLFVGDLAGYGHAGALRVAHAIAALRTLAIVVPGNHDGVHAAQLVAEVAESDAAAALLGMGMPARVRELRAALEPVPLCGYEVRPLHGGDGERIDCIVGRPHSFGGPRLAYRAYLRETFGIDTLEASAAHLCALVDRTETERVVFLAHNGPSGLGDRRDAIWGVDFRRHAGDHGDPDLRAAIEHARRTGKQVVAVLAGHMHQRLRGGGRRAWTAREGETLFVNAARVPRTWTDAGVVRRHWVEVEIDGAHAEARAVIV
jgi:uncharacterized protein (TIGR04168 family)